MVCQPLRLAFLIGAITAVAVSPVRADFRAPGCCDPCGPSTTAPAFRTVTCTEWVRESYTTKKTVYKVECRTETYDTCKTECVPVCKDVEVCVTKRVPVWTEECRKVCKKVTVYEEKMVKKTTHKFVQETVTKKHLVRLGHWECKEVTPLLSGGLFSGHGHSCGSSGCGDSCGSCAPACTKTRKVWVHCPEYRECPVTVCKKVCVTECVPCKVAVCKNVWTEEKVKVCKYTCVTEKCIKKVTTYEKRTVACKATRTVRVCVPCETTVTCCKLVPKTVTRQVPCAPACTTACTTSCCPREGLLSRLKDRFASHGCGRDCSRPACCN